MFFAAERELRGIKRRPDPDRLKGLTVDSEMDISLGSPRRPRVSPKKSLESVYPQFSATSMNEIIKLADPDFPADEERPTKKQRSTSPPKPALGDLDIPQPIVSPTSEVKTPKQRKFDTLDDLIKTFPELQDLIHDQERRRAEQRVPVDYVRPYQKPKTVESASAAQPIVSSEQTTSSLFGSLPKDSDNKTLSMATSTPEATSTPATPAEPVPGMGGGLLAGIDDLFGDSKRTKLKSKSRR